MSIRLIVILALLATGLGMPGAAALPDDCEENGNCLRYVCWGHHGPYVSERPCATVPDDLEIRETPVGAT